MVAHDSADARTVLLATYLARHGNAQASMQITSCSAPSKEWNGDKGRRATSAKGTKGGFETRGRTIYNANTRPIASGEPECATLRELARIDAEEAQRKQHWEQFLMAARGDSDEEVSSSSMTESGDDDLFALYTHI